MSVMSGKEVRMRRIFKDDGKAVISALDMGLFASPQISVVWVLLSALLLMPSLSEPSKRQVMS